MGDRRRINGPASGTTPPVFAFPHHNQLKRPSRPRTPGELRKIFLQTGLVASASGSAYLELASSTAGSTQSTLLIPSTSSLKIACSVHGPRPLPRSAPFSPQLVLSTHVRFAPFASRQRRGYVRDVSERDLGVHLESALRGVIIGERWPKSGLEVVVTVLEGEEDLWHGDAAGNGVHGVGMMTVLAGCITAASAAIVEAGVDCIDLVTGGVAAVIKTTDTAGEKVDTKPQDQAHNGKDELQIVSDPCPSEHQEILAACVVGYLASTDEITEVWLKGDVQNPANSLIDRAIEAAVAARTVLEEAMHESVRARLLPTQDVIMSE